MSEEIKIATLIISSNTYPAVRNSNSQKSFFFDEGFKKNLTFWYKAGSKKELHGQSFKLIGNDLLINTSDSSLNMGRKTILALEWLDKNCDYDFVVRPTPSSYINYENLYSFINNNLSNQHFVYCGKIQSTNDVNGNKIDFVSGSTFILNKNTVKEIINNKSDWDHAYWDDVALSLLMKKLKISPQSSERFDVQGNPYKYDIPKNYYQYRCRCDNHYGYPRFLESINLKVLHKLIYKKNQNKLFKYLIYLLFEFSKLIYIYQFGWKVYQVLRFLLKNLLPNKIYNLIKVRFKKEIENFKNVRFKF